MKTNSNHTNWNRPLSRSNGASSARRRHAQGSSLVLVVVLVAIASIIVAAALTLSSQRRLVSARSAEWNRALPVAEAGVEEALTQLQYGNAATNGWRLTNGYYLKSVTNPIPSCDCYYSVAIAVATPPTITSAGYVRAPLQNAYISRTIQVTTKSPGKFPYGMLAKNLIAMSGNSTLNSFNSCDPSYSTGGLYDPSKSRDQIKIASDSTGSPAISVGTSKVSGYVDTGPGGTVTCNNSGAVGDGGYVGGGSTGVEANHASHDMNVALPDVLPPYTAGASVVSGTYLVGGTNYSWSLGATNYYLNGNLGVNNPMIVTNQATLYVAGSFTISGGGYIYIAPGASLTLYVGVTNKSGNTSFSLAGQGVANGTGQAGNFTVYCMSSVKTGSYTGGANFVGTVYAPNTNFTLGGGSDASGAIVAQAISLSGGTSFHYDECLGQGDGVQKFVLNSWTEL